MKIESIFIKNFRSFREETIYFDDYTCLVGPNGAGKSTVLNALNVFFRQYKDSKTDLSKLSINDFHHKNTAGPIVITVTFKDLNEEAQELLAAYVRQEKLIISSIAVYDAQTERAEVKQFGNRLGFESFRRYFEADKSGAKVPELKDIYQSLKRIYTELPNASTKADMVDALQAYEALNSDQCVLILSEDQFYGVSKGADKLSQFIQWVFVPASKDFSEEGQESKNSALGQLLARTVRSRVNFTERMNTLKQKFQEEYQAIVEAEQSTLDEISESLKSRLQSWAHPGINAQVAWAQETEKSVKVDEPFAHILLGERGFDGELARFGHGLQRSFLLALLQELANTHDASAPRLIMGIEEPELYQHPPQAKYLAETLSELTEQQSQIIVCSHSPQFILGDGLENVRLVRESGEPSASSVTQTTYTRLSELLQTVGENAIKENGMIAKLYPSLNPAMSEMFFCNVLILTEGIEDIAYIMSYLTLTEKIKEFRQFGCHIVPVNGKNNLIKPSAIAKQFGIPCFVIWDADADKKVELDDLEAKQQQGLADDKDVKKINQLNGEIKKHQKDNMSIQTILEYSPIEVFPVNDIFHQNFVMWKSNITHVLYSEFGEEYQQYENKAAAFYDNAGGLQKNPLAIAKALELAWNAGIRSEALSTLVDNIVDFARSTRHHD